VIAFITSVYPRRARALTEVTHRRFRAAAQAAFGASMESRQAETATGRRVERGIRGVAVTIRGTAMPFAQTRLPELVARLDRRYASLLEEVCAVLEQSEN